MSLTIATFIIIAIASTVGQLARVDNDTTTYLENGFGKAKLVYELNVLTPNVSIAASHVSFPSTHSVLGYNVSHKTQSLGVFELLLSIIFSVPGKANFKFTVEVSNLDFLGYKNSYAHSTSQNVFGIGLFSENNIPVRSRDGTEYFVHYSNILSGDNAMSQILTVVYPPIFSKIISLANLSVTSESGLISLEKTFFQKNGKLTIRIREYRIGNGTVFLRFPHVFSNDASNRIQIFIDVTSKSPAKPVLVSEKNLTGTFDDDHQIFRLSLKMYNVPESVLDVMVFSQKVSFSLNRQMSEFNSNFQKIVVETNTANFGDSLRSEKKRKINSVYVRLSHGLAVQGIVPKRLYIDFGQENAIEVKNSTGSDNQCQARPGQQCASGKPKPQNDRPYANNTTNENQTISDIEEIECSGVPENECFAENNVQKDDKLKENNIVAIVTVSVLAFITAVILCVALVRWWRSRSVYYAWQRSEKNGGSSPPFASDSNRKRSAFDISP